MDREKKTLGDQPDGSFAIKTESPRSYIQPVKSEKLWTATYDTENGGPPIAFRCEIASHWRAATKEEAPASRCARVTRTEAGMWSHLRIVHGIKRQGQLWELESKEKTK